MATTQLAYRTSRGAGVFNASPEYQPLPGFARPEGNIRCSEYSPCGTYFAWADTKQVHVIQASSANSVLTLPLENVYELGFSPKGTYIITWQRPSKDETTGDAVKNLKVWRVSEDVPDDQKETIGKFVQKSQTGWNLQYTFDERFCARVVTNEVQIYESHDLTKVWNKLRVEGVADFAVSPGENHSIAVFVPERKGQPAAVRVFNVPNFTTPVSQKTFFKGDKVQLKWNDAGTSLIVLAQTEVDKSGKSYYGETTMYLLSANGGFDARVDLDKEGPIHDVTWSPRSNNFAVVYGYMPAKTVVFNAKAEPVHTFPLGPRNFVNYSPHGRYMLVAGFGNLAGQMDIYDLEKDYAKICTIEASNASICAWSPDGKHILTATTSPRLRVDNGIRIWHASGPLIYNEEINELYNVCWRPQPTSDHPLPANPLSDVPTPHASASDYMATKKTPSKPVGAYRPPGARGTITPLAFKREDEGGSAYVRDGTSSFSSNASNIFGKARPRVVPGAEPVEQAAEPSAPGVDNEPQSKSAKKNAKKREAKKAAAAAEAAGEPSTKASTPEAKTNGRAKSPNRMVNGRSRTPSKSTAPAVPPGLGLEIPTGPRNSRSRSSSRRQTQSQPQPQLNGTAKQATKQAAAPPAIETPPPPPVPEIPAQPPVLEVSSPTTPGSGINGIGGPDEKKVRGLLKKIRAIDDLKMRQAGGEKLEDTQVKKITSEESVRKELAALGYTGTT